MKRTIIALVVILMMGLCAVSYSYAEVSISDTLSKLPADKNGVAFNVVDSKFEYINTLQVIEYKGITGEVGFATNDKVVGAIGYNLFNAKEQGVKIPVVDLLNINVGVYAGYGRIAIGPDAQHGNNEFSYGPKLTVVDVKF